MLTDVSACSHTAASMPVQQEGHRPAEGDPPKQHGSRFRPDGRRRRMSGEIAKRAPHAQHWKDIQPRQRQHEHERASSSHQRQAHEPQHFRIHTDEDQEDQSEPDGDGPGVEKKTMVPGMAGTMTSGRMRTTGAGRTTTKTTGPVMRQ